LRIPEGGLTALLAAPFVAAVAVGLALTAAGVGLGAPAAPFLVHWDPAFSVRAAVGGAICAAAALAAPALVRPGVRPLAFAAGAVGIGLAARLALTVPGGVDGWYAVFGSAPEAGNEYLPALAGLEAGVRPFLDRFAELAPTLPIHPSAHPPGFLLTLHALGIDGARGAAALAIGGGLAAIPLTYLLGRNLLDESAARAAALLFALAPSPVLYGATSADALFATLGVAAAAGLTARRPIARAAGAVLAALASFFSYALLAGAAWAAAVVLRRDGMRAAIAVALGCATALVALYGGLHAVTGFDPFGSIDAAGRAYRLGIANARPYAFWLFGSPAAFLVAMGLPLAWLALRATVRGEHAAVALAAVVAVSAVLGFTKAETERIWLFLVPFACIAAAGALSSRRLRPVLALLAAQAIATEVLLETIW
jgi:hypothetical protein